MSNSLRPHGLQHSKLPCPSSTPGACSNSCLSSQWCHPTISPSFIPFSYLQSFPASRSFPMSPFFASGGQSIGVSASVSVFPMNSLTSTQQQKAKQTENQQLFLDASENWGHKTNHCHENWRDKQAVIENQKPRGRKLLGNQCQSWKT